jgi:hypothetical protein
MIAIGLLIVIITRIEAGRMLDPTSVDWDGRTFRIDSYHIGDVAGFSFVDTRDGSVRGSVGGEMHVCDPPHIVRLDADGDGVDDFYYTGCNGEGIISYDAAHATVDLVRFGADHPEPPALSSLWFQEWKSGGWRLTLIGCLVALAGLVGFMIVGRRGKIS